MSSLCGNNSRAEEDEREGRKALMRPAAAASAAAAAAYYHTRGEGLPRLLNCFSPLSSHACNPLGHHSRVVLPLQLQAPLLHVVGTRNCFASGIGGGGPFNGLVPFPSCLRRRRHFTQPLRVRTDCKTAGGKAWDAKKGAKGLQVP